MDITGKVFLILLVTSCFDLNEAGLLSTVGDIITNVTTTVNDILTVNLSAVNNLLNGIIVNNLASLIANDGVLDPSCNNILIERVCPNPNITFWLYTNTTDAFELKEYDADNLRNAPFIQAVPLDIIIHGYTGNKSYTPNPEIRPEYLSMGHNVISVDYGPAAAIPCYIQSFINFPTVANCTTRFIIALLQNTNITIGSIHITGLSLGAHVGGLTGTLLTTANENIQPKRLTGLDPAGPLFESHSYVTRGSANFVEAIHTNVGFNGEVVSDAHINFYVNGVGVSQPACYGDVKCSHEISSNYFGEAINSTINPTKGFYGLPDPDLTCTSSNQVLMGPYTPPRDYNPNNYYVNTNVEAPFGQGPVC